MGSIAVCIVLLIKYIFFQVLFISYGLEAYYFFLKLIKFSHVEFFLNLRKVLFLAVTVFFNSSRHHGTTYLGSI